MLAFNIFRLNFFECYIETLDYQNWYVALIGQNSPGLLELYGHRDLINKSGVLVQLHRGLQNKGSLSRISSIVLGI